MTKDEDATATTPTIKRNNGNKPKQKDDVRENKTALQSQQSESSPSSPSSPSLATAAATKTRKKRKTTKHVHYTKTEIPPPSIRNALIIYFLLPIGFLAFFSILYDPKQGLESYKNKHRNKHVKNNGNNGHEPIHAAPKMAPKKDGMPPIQDFVNHHQKIHQQQKKQQQKQNKQQQEQQKPQNNIPQTTTQSSVPHNQQQQQHNVHPEETQSQTVKIYDEHVKKLRQQHKNEPNDIYKALSLADALYQRDLTYHDGGSAQEESISTYKIAIQLIETKRNNAIAANLPTNKLTIPSFSPSFGNLNDELFLDNSSKSTDGLLVNAYCNLAKQYYMANMFEKAVESYDQALAIEPQYLDALNSRGSTLIILGQYEQAASDFLQVLHLDRDHIIVDAFTGLAKILVAKESVVPEGWQSMVGMMEDLIVQKEAQLSALQNNYMNNQEIASGKSHLVADLKKLHLALFSYHDHKTKLVDQAWDHLAQANAHKMSSIPPYNSDLEARKIEAIKQVFGPGFWPVGVGLRSKAPIFIVGFVRSGSTLLERLLDAHPLIVGTGEDSVFNGRLGQIRDAVVQASTTGRVESIQSTVLEQAKQVLTITKRRWLQIEKNSANDSVHDLDQDTNAATPSPKRFVDKMLTNYVNIGFIHLLFPSALILHVAREPMDTIFSSFKHDFPPSALDYTSEFRSLAQMYRGYRDIMDHWDAVLPGRVTHIRYEDMVNDMPGVAKAVIDATGLEWDPDVLNFHKKKQAVNTLSTTQVRKGVYKDGMKSWKKYEDQLKPLVRLVGKRTIHQFHTTLKGYKVPSQ